MKTNYIFVGLGNPGSEYEESRHSIGRKILLSLQHKPTEGLTLGEWHEDYKNKSITADGKLGSNKFKLILPQNFMNNSGLSLRPVAKTKGDAKNLVILQDDIDLPLGSVKICYNRGSGGHRGVESIVKNLKTQEFTRLRIGISPTSPSGKIKKPSSDKVTDFVIAPFKKTEAETLKKVIKKTKLIISSLITEGLDKTMNQFN